MSSGPVDTVTVTFPPLSPFLTLNSKLRAWICSYLKELDKRNLRQVCKVFKDEIDRNIGLSVNLDERKFLARDVQRTLPPSVSKLRLWGSTLTPNYLNRLLLNSRLLTSVQFTGPIDLSNFRKVLTRCPNLSLVSITRKSRFEDFRGQQLPLKIRSVRNLHLGTKGHFSDYSLDFIQFPEETPWQTYASIISNLTFPCLRTFSFEFTVLTSYFPILQCIFRFLASHRTIQNLMLRILKGPTYTGALDCIKLAYTHHQLPGLDLVRLNFARLIMATEPISWIYWDLILRVQVNLVHFDCSADSKSWKYFEPIITRNSETLRVLKFRELNTSTEELRINLGVLAKCKSLEELLISRFSRTTEETAIPIRIPIPITSTAEGCGKLPQLSGLNLLPSSLKRLAIQGLRVTTDDLAMIPNNLKKLEVLELQLLGYKPQIPDVDFESAIPFMGPPCRLNPFPVPIYLDVSRHGLGVTPLLLQTFLTNFRKLNSLFVEEFYNNRTNIGKYPDLNKAISEINLIVGNNLLSSGGYFGVLVDTSGRKRCLGSFIDFDTVAGMNPGEEESMERGDGDYLRAWDPRIKAYELQNIRP